MSEGCDCTCCCSPPGARLRRPPSWANAASRPWAPCWLHGLAEPMTGPGSLGVSGDGFIDELTDEFESGESREPVEQSVKEQLLKERSRDDSGEGVPSNPSIRSCSSSSDVSVASLAIALSSTLQISARLAGSSQELRRVDGATRSLMKRKVDGGPRAARHEERLRSRGPACVCRRRDWRARGRPGEVGTQGVDADREELGDGEGVR